MNQARLCAAVANGDAESVRRMLEKEGADIINQPSKEGFAPLCIASFWGYADIVKLLLEHGADVNVRNKGTGWTPCHCAAFQGHGKVLLYLTQHKPDLTIRDAAGRLASDFASALDTVWPFFAAQGFKRTSKADLIRMDIVTKTTDAHSGSDAAALKKATAHFSRPGSAYVIKPIQPAVKQSEKARAAFLYGDVLANDNPRCSPTTAPAETKPQLNMWRT